MVDRRHPESEVERAALAKMTDVVVDAGGDPERPRTRRQLLRLAGAAVAGGAGMAIAGANTAGAATGGNFVLGNANTADQFTRLNASTSTGSLTVGTENLGSGSITAIQAIGQGTYPDIKLSGTGKLGMVAFSGDAQPADLPALNDLAKSDTGALWSGTGALFSSTRSWKRINAVRVDNPNGDGTPFAPFRFLDTRLGAGTPLSATVTTSYDARAHANIPDDTIAIIGNVTAVTPSYPGFITLFPQGQPVPTVSNVNFVTGDIVANFFFLGLASNGQFSIRPGNLPGGTTHCIIDIFGYVQ